MVRAVLLAHMYAWYVKSIHAKVNMWRSEFNFEEPVLCSFFNLATGMEHGSSDLQGLLYLLPSPFNHS